MLDYLKEKWKLNTFYQVIAILVVFSLSGTTVVLIRPYIFKLIGIDPGTHLFEKMLCYLLLILPLYQLLLLIYGWVFGQQSFFTNKLKRLINKIPVTNKASKDAK